MKNICARVPDELHERVTSYLKSGVDPKARNLKALLVQAIDEYITVGEMVAKEVEAFRRQREEEAWEQRLRGRQQG